MQSVYTDLICVHSHKLQVSIMLYVFHVQTYEWMFSNGRTFFSSYQAYSVPQIGIGGCRPVKSTQLQGAEYSRKNKKKSANLNTPIIPRGIVILTQDKKSRTKCKITSIPYGNINVMTEYILHCALTDGDVGTVRVCLTFVVQHCL